MKSFLRLVLAAAFGAILLTGCASMREESDLPWNAPQPWEGAPQIPGFDGQR